MHSQSEILKGAMALPSEMRADLAAELLASLDAVDWERPEAVEAAWSREIQRRLERLQSGDTSTEPCTEVRGQLGKRFT